MPTLPAKPTAPPLPARFRRAAALLALAAACATAAAQPATGPTTRAVLIDRELRLVPGAIVSLDAKAGGTGEIVFIDDAGTRSTIDLATLLAVAPASFLPGPDAAGDDPADPDAGVLELADGQRLVGTLIDPPAPAAGRERPAMLRHNRLGLLSTPLDAVARYIGPGFTPPPDPSRTTDTVIISTGDRIEGLVDILGPTVTISPAPQRPGPGAAAEPVSAPGLVFAQLSNPAIPPRGLRVWLADGTVVSAGALSLRRSEVSITTGPPDAATSTDLLAGEFRGLAPDASRLLPLASLPPASVRIDPSRPFGDPPVVDDQRARVAPLGAPDVLLPGPMSVEWVLPAGVGGVLGAARLDAGCSAWGDCRVVVEIVPGPGGGAAASARPALLAEGRLAGGEPTLAIRAAFEPVAAGTRLRVTVDPGNRGPIQDRVVLSRMLLVAPGR